MTSWVDELITTVESTNVEALSEHPLCNSCLGRRFASIGRGIPNSERGEHIRNALAIKDADECWVCDGLTSDVETMSETIIASLEGYNMSNILIGTKSDPIISAREDELTQRLGKDLGEPIKAELNRNVGKIVSAKLEVDVNFEKPEVVAIIDTRFFAVDVQSNPVYFEGVYRKMLRTIPQTRWPCRTCRGKGCNKCNDTGKMYQTSVEEEIGRPSLVVFEAKDHRFHGMGREDIDVRMLGTGRPFVFEMKDPKRRIVDLKALEKEINELSKGVVDVESLEYSSKERVVHFKEVRHDKTYEVRVKIEDTFDKTSLHEACKKIECTLEQRTPSRVAHRRADLVRKRTVRTCDIVSIENDEAVLRINAETGTYIKEMLNGDEGRTSPNLAGLLDTKVSVVWLDVVGIDTPKRG